jgi:hypothetical protein
MSKRRQEWEEICHSLAPEGLYEDGELNDYEAEQKRKRILRHARALYKAGYPCPKDVLDMCDDEEALQPFVEETNDEQ